MGLTRAQKHNRMLGKIFTPEIERLKKLEEIAKSIIAAMDSKTEIDYCGLQDWQLINLVTKELNKGGIYVK